MIEDLVSNLTPGQAVLYFIGAFFLACLARKLQVQWQLSRLGARAPKVHFRLPYAMDFIYKSMQANQEDSDLDFWSDAVRNAKGAPLVEENKTAELDAGISTRLILTRDPENIKAILTGQFADYGKGESFHRDWREFLGDSIFVTDGEQWHASRQLIRPMFVRDRLVDTEIFEKHVQHLIPLLGGEHGSKVVDVTSLFFRYTLDAATDYLLGQGTDSLQNPETTFAEAFRYVQRRQSQLFRLGVFKFILSRKEFRRQLKVMDDFIQPYIDRVLAMSPAELDQKLSKQETFLHALARFTRDRRQLRDQLVAVLLAGRDTTAATLSFCLFELGRNPEVVTKLREEISSRLGVGANAQKPTYADLKDMKYLNAVLHESMRLYPVVPFNVRFSLKDTTLPRGGGPDGLSPVAVKAGSRVVYSTMIMQRSPDNYEPASSPNYFDPAKWIPERWVSGWQPKPWHFIPFNGGPRICIGQQFAMIEMGYTVVRILQAYESIQALPQKGESVVRDPKLRFEVTLTPASELSCVFVRDGEGENNNNEKAGV
ncbi:cytochrome P450 [Aspergillus karnatakaensis]|uniref:cytochrome P450 n=1 Tax=Aspergillus karnatakaensis TaxID=1810916 RepID=UPI003CCD93DF